MKWFVYLLIPHFSHAQDWKPVSFEKIQLIKTIPESVIFTKNQKGKDVAYTVSYVLGKEVLKTSAIPLETYIDMTNRLQKEVVSFTKKTIQNTCSDEIAIISGLVSEVGKAKSVCLRLGGETTRAERNFRKWYKDTRSLLGL